jgi:hypothetical protein
VAGRVVAAASAETVDRGIRQEDLGVDVYHIWFNLKDGVRDTEFADAATAYLDHLKTGGMIAGYRVIRCKLGLGHPNLPEWNITLDFENMSQMDRAFGQVSSRADPVESFHHAVNSKVRDIFFALYRDFPDPGRVRGEEKF